MKWFGRFNLIGMTYDVVKWKDNEKMHTQTQQILNKVFESVAVVIPGKTLLTTFFRQRAFHSVW